MAKIWAWSLWLLWAGAAVAADRPTYAPPGRWVQAPAIPAAAGHSGGAVEILLADCEMRFRNEGNDFYVERALRVATPEGLQAANVRLAWNPETQDLVVHRLRILRGDKVIDLLAGPDKLTVLRRETNLEMAALDGSLTATMQPEGVQVGDTIDLAYTLTDHDPTWKGLSEAIFEDTSNAPAREWRVRAVWGPDKTMRWRIPSGLGTPTVTNSPQGHELVIEHANFEAPTPPARAPERFDHQSRIVFSEIRDWDQAAALLAPLYEHAETLAPESPLRAEIARIEAQSNDPKVRAAAALKLTEQEVRYFFVGLDLGGMTPADADVTWRRRFGDCKGKTVLLLALLKALGIEAEPALVSTSEGDSLPGGLPRLGGFNHVIVRATIDGKTYWLDSTRPADRGVDDIPAPNFEWTLPLRRSGSTLVAIERPPPSHALTEIETRIDLSAGPDAPAPFHLNVVFSEDVGMVTHLGLASMAPADAERKLRETWTASYPWVTVERVGWSWEEATGRLRISMDGKAHAPWTPYDGGRQLIVPGTHLGGEISLERQPGPDHDAPYATLYPFYSATRTTIILPDKGRGYSLQGGADVDHTIGSLALYRRSRLESGVMTVETSDRSLAREFPARDAEAVAAAFRDLGSKDVWIDGPPAVVARSAPEAAHRDAASMPAPKTATEFVTRAALLLHQGREPAALADIGDALKLAPNNSAALTLRGLILSHKGDTAAARADFDSAARLDPKDDRPLLGRAALLAKTGDMVGAQREFDAAIELAPDSPEPIVAAAFAFDAAGHFETAVAYYDRLIANFPTDPHLAMFLNNRCYARAKWNHDLNRALADCRTALSLAPKNGAVLDSRGFVELRLGQLSDAIDDYDQALDNAPGQAESLFGRGVAKLRKGDAAGAKTDIAAATRVDPQVVERFAGWGVTP